MFKKVTASKGCGSGGSRQGHAETEERDGGDIDRPKGDGGMMRRTMLEVKMVKMVFVKAIRIKMRMKMKMRMRMKMKMKMIIITMTMK